MVKIVLVCDWLTTPGGAEKLLLELHKMYPNAPIYTSQYRPKKIDWFADAKVKTGWLNIFPASLRKVLGPLRQLYFQNLDLSDYDVVISVTGAEAKSIKTKSNSKKAFHICYCHVPTQYYWQMYDKYLDQPGFGIFNPLVKLAFKLLVKPLRKADYKGAQRPDQFVTISEYAKEQIKKYYDRDAIIVHPPVDTKKFSTGFSTSKTEVFHRFNGGDSYFAIVCRQATWKRVDLAIQACIKEGKNLLVVGDGAEHHHLVELAKGAENIQFTEWLDTAGVAECLHGAEAFLFPSMEPFGIAAVEALAAGCPVIAYAEGGSRDFIKPGENGELFAEQTVESLAKAIQEFNPQKFNRTKVSQSAEKFDTKYFCEGIKNLVERASKNE